MKLLSRAQLFGIPWTVACTKLLRSWDFLGKSTGVGCRFLLQVIFLTQGSNPGLPHCRQMLYCLSHQGNPRKTNTKSTNKRTSEEIKSEGRRKHWMYVTGILRSKKYSSTAKEQDAIFLTKRKQIRTVEIWKYKIWNKRVNRKKICHGKIRMQSQYVWDKDGRIRRCWAHLLPWMPPNYN